MNICSSHTAQVSYDVIKVCPRGFYVYAFLCEGRAYEIQMHRCDIKLRGGYINKEKVLDFIGY